LRERINDIAAEVARLAVTLEGPGSPIDAILADDTARVNGRSHGVRTGAQPEAAPGNLADRIRALQSRVSRVQQ
jgi:hypothetical protein